MKKMIFISILLLLVSQQLLAQKIYNNSVKLSINAFAIPARNTGFNFFRQTGVSYERKIFKSFYSRLSYQQWQSWFLENSMYKRYGYGVDEPGRYYSNIDTGTLVSRQKYKMLDVGVLYRFRFKKHILNSGLAVSYCWGENVYLKEYSIVPINEVTAIYTGRNVRYWGIVPQLSYDHLFLKNRLCAGADIRARYYTHRAPAQYDYGVHVGVNF